MHRLGSQQRPRKRASGMGASARLGNRRDTRRVSLRIASGARVQHRRIATRRRARERWGAAARFDATQYETPHAVREHPVLNSPFSDQITTSKASHATDHHVFAFSVQVSQ
jgi:hypothetical protein